MTKYSVREAVDKHIENIDKLMGNLTAEIEKCKALEQVHCGHVGDLAYVEDLLILAWEFITGTLPPLGSQSYGKGGDDQCPRSDVEPG